MKKKAPGLTAGAPQRNPPSSPFAKGGQRGIFIYFSSESLAFATRAWFVLGYFLMTWL